MSLYLITGGAGFIGSHIADELVRQGQMVRILDNFCTGTKNNLKNILNKVEIVKGDIRNEKDVNIEHEATVGKVGEEQLFYLMSRGLSEDQALTMVVSGFMEPFTKELPLEYAIELNRLIAMNMEGSVG